MTEITTERLLLRPPRHVDIAAIVRQLNNFAVSQWTARVPFPYGTDDGEAFVTRAAALPAGDAVLAVTLRASGDLIGVIGCEAQAAGGAELGYWLGEDHWRQGYGREAAAAMVRHALDALLHAHLVASYQIGNAGSQRILEGLGFRATHAGRSFSLARNADTDVVHLRLDRGDRRP